MTSYQNKKSHCGDKTVVRSSYLHKMPKMTRKMGLWSILHTSKSSCNMLINQVMCACSGHSSFDLFGNPKLPENRASETHILRTSKSNSNEHVKQDWCESSGSVWQNGQKPKFITWLGVQNDLKIWVSLAYFLHTSKSSCSKLINQVSCEFRGTFPENNKKNPTYWPILAKFRFKRGQKIWPTGAIFSHTPESTQVPTMCL